jgi:hypothetical protein
MSRLSVRTLMPESRHREPFEAELCRWREYDEAERVGQELRDSLGDSEDQIRTRDQVGSDQEVRDSHGDVS